MLPNPIIMENEKFKCGEFLLSQDYTTWTLKCILCIAYCKEIGEFIDHIRDTHQYKEDNILKADDPLITNKDVTIECDDIKKEPIYICLENIQDSHSNRIIESNQDELELNINDFFHTSHRKVDSNNDSSQLQTISAQDLNTSDKKTKRKYTRKSEKLTAASTVRTRRKRQISKTKETEKAVTSQQIVENNDNTKDTGNTSKKSKKKSKRIYSNVFCDICDRFLLIDETMEKHKLYYHDFIDPFLNDLEYSDVQKNDDENGDDNDDANESKIFDKNLTMVVNNSEVSDSTMKEIRRKDPCLCKYCPHRSTSAGARVVHERSHTGERPYECDVCKKRFVGKHNYLIHRKKHDETKRFPCEICGILLKSIHNLSEHMVTHGERQFQCDYCPKKFLRKTDKLHHERVHTGERPYQCNECGKCFLRSTILTAHARRHAGIKPYKCSYCEKSFYTNEYLKNHIVVHTGERPFTCEICSATFPRKKALRQHKKIHSDVRGYVCSICGKSYKQYSGLYVHKRSHGLVEVSGALKQENNL